MKTNSWKPQEIKSLRLRMGWCVSDLSRRLNLPESQVKEIESGVRPVNDLEMQGLELLNNQANSTSREMGLVPVLELRMCVRRTEQETYLESEVELAKVA